MAAYSSVGLSLGSCAASVRSPKSMPSKALSSTFSGLNLHISVLRYSVSLGRTRIPIPVVKAVDDSSSELDSEKFLEDIKEKWSSVDNKPAVALYAGGALTLIWLSSAIVGAIGSVPLLPKILELVGVAYTGWFVYRYLLFKTSRKELASELEELKSKVTGAGGGVEK